MSSDEFKALLDKHGFNNSAFARKLGCSRATVINWTQRGVPPVAAVAVRCVLGECR